MRLEIPHTLLFIYTFLLLPFVLSSKEKHLRRKTAASTTQLQVKKLSGKIVGINLLIEDLNDRAPDADNDIRVNWVGSLIDTLEREIDEVANNNVPKNQVKALSDGIIDLKNEMMRAKEKITISLLEEIVNKEENFLESGFSEEKVDPTSALLDKAEVLKTGITNLKNELMLFNNDNAEKTKKKNDEGSDRDSEEAGKSTTNNGRKNASVMASLIEFGVDSDKIADYFGISPAEMESTVEMNVMESDIAFSLEEEIIDETLEKEINFLTALGASEEQIKDIREEKKKSLGEYDP